MDRLGIAFSGGANPAEIVDCVKLAETLGYEFGLGCRRAWRRPVRGIVSLRSADLENPTRNQHHQCLRPHGADDRDGCGNGRCDLRRAFHPWGGIEPQGPGRAGARRALWQAADTGSRECRDHPRATARRPGQLCGRDDPYRGLRPVVHTVSPADPDLSLRGLPKDDDPVRRDRRRRDPDAKHAGHRSAGPGAARRRGQASRPRPEHDRRHLAVADCRRRDPQGGARRAAAGARLLCRLLSPLQPHDGRARLSRRGGRHCCGMVARRPRSGRARGQRRADRRHQRCRDCRSNAANASRPTGAPASICRSSARSPAAPMRRPSSTR